MTITATFSNGFVDTYKGDRPVKAAWMLTDKETGKVLLSGHSLDRAKAEKTARGNINHIILPGIEGRRYYVPQSASMMNKEYAKELLGRLKENGDEPKGQTTVRTVWDAARRANTRYNDLKRARINIEVIDL